MKLCKAHGRRWCWSCVIFTVSFPVEHFLWEHTPLRVITVALGI